MKARWRCLSWVLALAMMVTSIPAGSGRTVYAAQESGQTETTEKAVSPDHGLLKWNEDNLYLGEDEQISEDGQTYTKTPRTFEGASANVYPSTNTYQNYFDLNSQEFKDKMKEAFQIEGEIQYTNEVEFSYQWYREDAQGNREKLEGETEASLQESYQAVASDGKVAFVLEIALNYIELEIEDAEGTYDTFYCRFSELPTDTDWDYTAEQVFPYEYTGLTKEDFESGKADLADYFEGLDTEPEVEVELDSADGTTELFMNDVRALYNYNVENVLNYKWIVNYEDSTAQPEEYSSEQDVQYIDSIYAGSFYNGKKVANYECQVELCYNGMVVGTLNKKFKVVYNPIIIENEPEVTVDSRNNGKQTFVVNAEIKDEEICSDILYQWYSVKDNKDTVMDGETTDTLKVKITDPSVSYKCVVTGKWKKGYSMDWSKAVVFKVHTIPGYRLHDRASRYVYTAMNEKAELYVDATVDNGYTLDYKWEKVDRRADSNEYVFETVGTASKLEVTPKDDKDFESYYVEEDEENEENYRYRLTVSIIDDKKQVVDTKKYYFQLEKSEETGYETESSSRYQDIFYGEPAEAYVKASVNDKHLVKQTWYYLIDSQVYYEKYNSETGSYENVFVQEGFKEPVCDKTESEYLKEEETEEGWRDYYTKYYYKKVDASVSGVKLSADGSALTVDALKEGRRFLCETEVFRKTNQENSVDTNSDTFILNVKTDLSAYAKSETIERSLGEQAVLEVSAQNFNTKTRPITYTWKKYDQEKNEFVTLDNKTAAYTISSVKEADYGEYRVEVSDEVESRTVRFNLTKERLETVVYTPENSYFSKAIGDEVTLTADIGFSADTKVFYEWYHEERTYDDDEGSYWELLNEDKKEYTFKLDHEKKYGRYKCVATYKNGNVSYTHTFIYHVNSNYAFTCERLTPSEQYKKMGDSITYQVRVLTDDPNIKEDQIKYQWYYYDESYNVVEIKDAVSDSYTIDKLAAENFQTIYCRITAVDAENQVLQQTSTEFWTYLYTDIYLEKSGESVEADLGSDVTLKPVLVNADNQQLTYQWYRNTKIYDEDNDYYYKKQMIYGATAKDYTVSKIGESEFGRYICEIMLDGIKIATYSANVVKNTEEAEVTVDYAEGMEEIISTTLGSAVKMEVTAKSNKNLKLKYQWYIVGGYYDDEDEEYYDSLKAIGGATAASYEIAKVMPKDLETYRCVVTDEKGNENWVDFEVRQTANLSVSTDSLYTSDVIGFETSYGEDMTLKATATTDPKYNIFYQWYKFDEETDTLNRLIGETSAELAIKNVSEKDLGRYQCEVYNEIDDSITLNYYVYVNTGLVVEPSVKNPVAVNGALKMYADARANAGEAISYQWFKYVQKEDGYGYEPISGANQSAYSIAKLMKEHYGSYRCIVSTKGESYAYHFDVMPYYTAQADREYAQKGNTVTFKTEIKNPAADAKYTYQWYAKDVVTGAYMKTKETGSSCKAVMPAVSSRQIGEEGYVVAAYKYRILDGESVIAEEDVTVNLLPDAAYSSKLPESSHPYDKRYSLQAYQNKGAKQLQITFDRQTDAYVTVIDKNGNVAGRVSQKGGDGTITVNGDSFLLLAYNDEFEMESLYGYKVAEVKRLGDPVPNKPQPQPQQPAKKVPAKGTKYTYKNVTYKVTKSAAKNGTVTVSGVKSKSLKSAVIQASVKINGYTFNVTAVDKNAFKGCKKLTSVKVGANVTSIGANAFNGCKKLKTITISTKKLKKVGSGTFKGIVKNAKIKVPSAKLKAYQKLLKNKGQGKKVKITK